MFFVLELRVRGHFRELQLALGQRFGKQVFYFSFFAVAGHGKFCHQQIARASSIFFSRKESGLSLARRSRLFSTTATSSREPVRILSEFSLKRNFQSWWLSHWPSTRKLRILLTSPFLTTGRRPTIPTLLKGTSTFKLLALILSR